jgi:uncharacterized protein (TIGR03084 family)
VDVAPREDVVAALAAQVDELDGLVAHLDEAGWTRASACAGWTVADVLVHLAQTNEVAQASLENRWETVLDHWGGSGGEGTVDDLAAAAVERSVIRRGPEVHLWWKATADAMVGAFAATDPRARVQWVVGDMAARTLCTTRLAETWIHTTDVAWGLGVELAPTERLWHIARLVHRTIPYSFARAGRPAPAAVRFELLGPDGSSWVFGDDDAPTVVTGSALDLCRAAGQRAVATDTSLVASGPSAGPVLELVRTFA